MLQTPFELAIAIFISSFKVFITIAPPYIPVIVPLKVTISPKFKIQYILGVYSLFESSATEIPYFIPELISSVT